MEAPTAPPYWALSTDGWLVRHTIRTPAPPATASITIVAPVRSQRIGALSMTPLSEPFDALVRLHVPAPSRPADQDGVPLSSPFGRVRPPFPVLSYEDASSL